MFHHDCIQDQLFADGVALIANKNRVAFSLIAKSTQQNLNECSFGIIAPCISHICTPACSFNNYIFVQINH
jgi:hypothetical protein